jgi:methionine biosynthesis protein MetW
MTVYGALVARHGLGTSHAILLDEVPPGSRVLDVGCAEGYVARELVARRCTVVGIERDAAAAEAAREVCEQVLVGDIEDATLRDRVGGTYDRVLFGDVLEHLRDGETVLRWARDLLTPDGRAVVSLPNVAHWSARRQVARGRFPRDEHGLFDRTHLRFFTRASAHALAREAGFAVRAERFADAPVPLESHVPALRALRAPLVRRAPELFALQVVLALESA